MWYGATGRGTPGPWMGTPPPHPIGMAALYLAEPRQRLGGRGGGKRRSLVSEQPRAGVHSDRRPHAPPLSPGTGHRPPRKSLRRRKGAAGWHPRSEVGSSEPGFRDPRSLWSCCRLSCASPGAIATPHRALRGRLSCGAHPDGGARGPDGSVSGARAGVGVGVGVGEALWEEALLMGWSLQGHREPPERGARPSASPPPGVRAGKQVAPTTERPPRSPGPRARAFASPSGVVPERAHTRDHCMEEVSG